MIQVVLPSHLRTLARVSGDVSLEVEGKATQRSILDALEARYPMLRGTIRDQVTQERRPFLRFFACEEDLSNELPDTPVPDAVARSYCRRLGEADLATIGRRCRAGLGWRRLSRLKITRGLRLEFLCYVFRH
jgi:molybdopterin synthase sulfur carrier subunit